MGVIMEGTADMGLEISDGLLGGIAGGVLSDSDKAALHDALAAWKHDGYTLEQALHAFRRGNSMNGDPQDYTAYANEIWESL